MADFVRFSEKETQDECLEINQKSRLSDAQLTDMLSQKSGCQNLGELSVEKRNQLIRQIQQETDSNIRQLSAGAGSR